MQEGELQLSSRQALEWLNDGCSHNARNPWSTPLAHHGSARQDRDDYTRLLSCVIEAAGVQLAQLPEQWVALRCDRQPAWLCLLSLRVVAARVEWVWALYLCLCWLSLCYFDGDACHDVVTSLKNVP